MAGDAKGTAFGGFLAVLKARIEEVRKRRGCKGMMTVALEEEVEEEEALPAAMETDPDVLQKQEAAAASIFSLSAAGHQEAFKEEGTKARSFLFWLLDQGSFVVR